MKIGDDYIGQARVSSCEPTEASGQQIASVHNFEATGVLAPLGSVASLSVWQCGSLRAPPGEEESVVPTPPSPHTALNTFPCHTVLSCLVSKPCQGHHDPFPITKRRVYNFVNNECFSVKFVD